MTDVDGLSRAQLIKLAQAKRELAIREAREAQSRDRGGLIEFVRYFWRVLEPKTPFVDGWPLRVICEHLEAVSRGEIKRLLINVPPGFMKSLLTDVFWPAWEWGPRGEPHLRYVAFSYASGLTERDNGKFRDLMISPEYQALWGKSFKLKKIGEQKVTNDQTGSKLASSVGGVATGERGDRVILDDPHSVKTSESDVVRTETVRWFQEAMSNRLNDIEESAVVIIMQRVHEADVAGVILSEELDYCHLMIPMEYERNAVPDEYEGNAIGWIDPRTVEGELAWPERFPAAALEQFKKRPFMWSGQYQQSPTPRGGAIILRDYWQEWPSDVLPGCEYILASMDTAYTTKQENDSSALTIWGVFRDSTGQAKVVMMWGWEGRLELYDLVTFVADICSPSGNNPDVPHFPVDRLIIEAKANGISVGQELYRLYGATGAFGIEMIDPKGGDKVNRMYSIQHLFADQLVYAPDRKWADMVINNVTSFPKAAHDDLADTVSQALWYMRRTGLLERRDEQAKALHEQMLFRPAEVPLY